MANGSPGVNVRGVQLTPPAIGLFAAAESMGSTVESSDVVGADEVERWGGGLHWIGDGTLDGTAPDQLLCLSYGTQFFQTPARYGSTDVYPFVTYGEWQCSTYQTGLLPEYIERARRRHLAFEQFGVERQLWNDFLGTGSPNISSATTRGAATVTVNATATTPYKALARLEQAMGVAYPAPFMIHMQPVVLEFLLGAGTSMLEKRGNVWLTSMGNVIIPGRGYTGSQPNGTAAAANSSWIYATAPVQVYRGRLADLALGSSAVQRDVNDKTVYSYRLNAATFDNINVVMHAHNVDIS
jgi:hypothetical protein